MIQRDLETIITQWLFRQKVLILYGARQVGKTTLVKTILEKFDGPKAYYNCEIQTIRQELETQDPIKLKKLFGERKLIVLDEAQKVPDIGLILKVFHDTFPEQQIIATGSSSFELANQTGEPLTGRALTFTLYPLSYNELSNAYENYERKALLENMLRFGMYPEIALSDEQQSILLLDQLSANYLYKDILEFEQLRKPDLLLKILQLLSLQIGQEISLQKMSNDLSVNQRTVARYIDLLEKTFVIFRLRPFSRGLRKEVTKMYKVYFCDLGIRNSLLRQYQPLKLREDKGVLWENYLIVERMKWLQVLGQNPNRYFWRTHDQQEIDYLEELNGVVSAYEFKVKRGSGGIPAAYAKTYPSSPFSVINEENFEDFISS